MTPGRAGTDEVSRQTCDRIAIIDTLSRVAHAQDDLDLDAYVNCFTDPVLLGAAVIIPDWTGGEIAARELAIRSFDRLARLDACHHLVTNHVIDLDGDEAGCVADFTAVSIVLDAGVTRALTTAGRYVLRLRRDGDRWRIRERAITARYQFGDPLVSSLSSGRDLVRTFHRPEGIDG